MARKDRSIVTPAPKAAVISARRSKAWTMRQGGSTIREIAQALGASVGTIVKDLQAVFEEANRQRSDQVAIYREIEGDRLDRLLMAVWGQANTGDLLAMDRVLKIIQQRAALYGLNAPVAQMVINDTHVRLSKAEDLNDDDLASIATGGG